MTRLTTNDITHISAGLSRYSAQLEKTTGRTLTGIAAHTFGADETMVLRRLKDLTIRVVPVTAGQGVITDFSDTVSAILSFMGCRAQVSEFTDATGLADAFETGADAVMLADDHRFVGIHLGTRCVADNTELTGRVYAAALDLMADGIRDENALVLGCGPVGEAGARELSRRGASLRLYDIDPFVSHTLKERLGKDNIPADLLPAFSPETAQCRYILEATPSAAVLTEEMVTQDLRVAAPGVPMGVSEKTARLLENRLVHDTLELGTAAMVVRLVL